MKTPALHTVNKNNNELLLIVDKENVIGQALAKEFSKDFVVVLASSSPPSMNKGKIIYIAYKNRIPKIPQYDYSKIFIIDDGRKITRDSLNIFIQKAKEIKADLYFITNIRADENKQLKQLTLFYDKVKVLFMGDLFDKNYIFSKNISISRYILQARDDGRLLVNGDGLGLSYPISLEDTIKLIIKASYVNIQEKYVLLFSPHPITDISLANTFQKINPFIKVDYLKEATSPRLSIPSDGLYAIKKYDIKTRLSELGLNTGEIVIRESKSKSQNKKTYPRRLIKFLILLLMACFFLFVLPLIVTVTYYGLGSWQFKESMKYAEKGDYNVALKKTKNANSFFNMASNTSEILVFQTKHIGASNKAEGFNKKIIFYKQGTNALVNIFEGLTYLVNVYSENNFNSKDEFGKFLDNFIKASISFQKLKSENENLLNIDKRLTNVNELMGLVSSTNEALPDIMGFNGEKNYLLVIQNENILRPGGGTVSVVSEVSLNKGKIKISNFIPINKINEKITKETVAPYEFQKHLNLENVKFNDILFSPDTFYNSTNALDLYSDYSNKTFDGVIVADLSFLQLLQSFNEEGKLVSKTDDIFSNENSNYLNSEQVSDAVIAYLEEINLSSDTNKSLINLSFLKALGEAIANKHLTINLKREDLQNNFYINNLTGSIVDNRIKRGDSVNDFFGISESNTSVNMVNLHVSRSVFKKVFINQDRTISSVVTVAYKNNSVKNANARNYENYVRLILPEGIRVIEISIGGKRQNIISQKRITKPTNFSNLSDDLEVSENTLLGKTVIGFYITVEPENLKTIKVDYALPFNLNDSGKTTYSILVYKQPGIVSYPFDLTFSLPNKFSVYPKNSISEDIYKDSEFKFIILEK